MIALLAAALAVQPLAPIVDRLAADTRFNGEILVGRGEAVLLHKGYGTVRPEGGKPHVPGARWRLASITKQVTAVLIVHNREHLAEPSIAVSLDKLISDRADYPGGTASIRLFLTHHTGLANPDETSARPNEMPRFYQSNAPDYSYCWSKPAVPDAPFSYNNCDYIVAARWALGTNIRWPNGMKMAQPGEKGVPGFVGGKAEPTFELSSFGAAGGLIGTARSVFDFNRKLMTGKLLKPASLAELWRPEGNGSYQALGQWVFPGKLRGCTEPVRIVQRDGEIAGVQTRNFILPEKDVTVILFTNRGSDDFPIGEVWQGNGFAFDLLSAAACPAT